MTDDASGIDPKGKVLAHQDATDHTGMPVLTAEAACPQHRGPVPHGRGLTRMPAQLVLHLGRSDNFTSDEYSLQDHLSQYF